MLRHQPMYRPKSQFILVKKRPARPYFIQVRATPIAQDIETISYLVGKSVMLFTMFYCTLNWYHYRTQRKQHEESDKKD